MTFATFRIALTTMLGAAAFTLSLPAAHAEEQGPVNRAWNNTRQATDTAWDKTKNGSEKAWDKTKEGTNNAWDKT
ncbi:MAG: endoglucanase, partial [Acetobacter malorum]